MCVCVCVRSLYFTVDHAGMPREVKFVPNGATSQRTARQTHNHPDEWWKEEEEEEEEEGWGECLLHFSREAFGSTGLYTPRLR